MTSKRELHTYCFVLLLIMSIGFLFFLFWPTSCPQLTKYSSNNHLFNITIKFDKQLNNLPSLHAAFTVYSWLLCNHMLRFMEKNYILRTIIGGWSCLLLVSILTTKQHMFIDLVSGSVLGVIGYIIFITIHSKYA